MKSYGVTIQMKPLWHNFCIALFIFFEIEFLPMCSPATIKSERLLKPGSQKGTYLAFDEMVL